MTNFDSLNNQEQGDDLIELKLIIFKYLKNWYWFVLSVFVLGVSTYIYLRYTTPLFKISASILIKDEKKGISGNDALKELEMFSGNKLVENEVEVLKSRAIIEKVVEDLNLCVSYYSPNKLIRDSELFGNSPIWVHFNEKSYQPATFLVEIKSPKEFELWTNEEKVGNYKFSDLVNLEGTSFRVYLVDSIYKSVPFKKIKLTYSPKNQTIQKYQGAIEVAQVNTKSTVLGISLEEANVNKGKAILGKLLNAYAFNTLKDKNHEATNTLQFIDERLKLITQELGDVEHDVESYKSSQGITDLSSEANLFLEKVKDNDSKLNEVDIQLKVLDGVENYLKSSQSGVAPATLMVTDPILVSLLTKLNELELQKDKYARSVQEDNPLYATVSSQIKNTKQGIREYLQNQKQGLVVTRNSLKGFNNQIEGAIRTIPRKEREFVNIKRQQGIKESLYLMLLQKKEETAISYASTVTDSRVIDEPYSSLGPVKPKKMNFYLIAIIIGLAIPAIILYLKDLLNDKIESSKLIQSKTGLPIFGEISKKPKDLQTNIVNLKGNSFLAEQFRILRTNLQYVAAGQKTHRATTILLTSSIGGEGKSFISLNLSHSLALLGKKVVLLELDLRKPRIASYLDIHVSEGISNYLIGQGNLTKLIKKSSLHENLDILPCGPIPPNPAELISNEQMHKMIEELQSIYDYVILDMPPVGLVTDAVIMGKYADAAFYVVRYGYTPKSNLKILNELKEMKAMKSLNVIFNGVDYQNSYEYGYGYGKYGGYGYTGYYSEEKS